MVVGRPIRCHFTNTVCSFLQTYGNKECIKTIYTVSIKSKPNICTITSKVANQFPLNLAFNINNKYIATWHNNYPLHLTYICTHTTL